MYVQDPLSWLASGTVDTNPVSNFVETGERCCSFPSHYRSRIFENSVKRCKGMHTRSSPIGPAEHDEGGSL